MVRRNKTNYVIQSVAHALDVLEQFFGEVDELGVTELSKRLKLHKNNVFRLLATLEARAYIEQNRATENYRLGIKCLHLGRRYIDHMGLVRQARPILSDVAHRCRESTFVAIMRREGVVPLESAEPGDRMVRIMSPLGQALPLHCTAVGKVHLAFDLEQQLRADLPEQLPRFTDRTSWTARCFSSSSIRWRATASEWKRASSSRTCRRLRCRFATIRAASSDHSRLPGRPTASESSASTRRLRR